MKHTPGPWKAVSYSGTRLTSIETIDHVSLGGIAGESNAILVASAPDLYSELEYLLELDAADELPSETDINRIKALLLKAGGGA